MITPDGEVPRQIEPPTRDICELEYDFLDGTKDVMQYDPEGEYQAWLLTRPDCRDLKALSERRTRRFERAPLKQKMLATAGLATAAAVAVNFATDTSVMLPERIAVGTFCTSICIAAARRALHGITPAQTTARQQRNLHNSYFGVE